MNIFFNGIYLDTINKSYMECSQAYSSYDASS